MGMVMEVNKVLGVHGSTVSNISQNRPVDRHFVANLGKNRSLGLFLLYFAHMMDSKDIFYIVLAFCALWFTAFLCFALYHIASFMKRMQELSGHVREKFDEAMETVNVIRMKVEGHVSAITSIGDGIRKVMDVLRNRDRD